ncbi:MAG: PIN domain-containing protein, partial [Planctomycetota bacterium]
MEPSEGEMGAPEAPVSAASAPAPQPAPPSVDLKQVRMPEGRDARAGRLTMIVVRSVFMVLLVAVTLLTVNAVRDSGEFTYATLLGLMVSSVAVGLLVVVVDALTPNKRLAGVVGVYMGVCLGLVGAVAFGALLDTIAKAWEIQQTVGVYLTLAKSMMGLVFCYLSISVVLTTKDDLRLVIPYVEFSRTRRGVRPWLLDTSVLIDGRLLALAATGFLDAPLVVPQFVVDELQKLADSGDRTKRGKGRRGLELLARLRESPWADLGLQDFRVSGMSVDRMLVESARSEGMRLLTLDANLEAVA